MSDTPNHDDNQYIVTPLPYEALHEGRDEEIEMARQRVARRRFLRSSTFAILGLAAVTGTAGAFHLLYPGITNQFGDALDIGHKAAFPAAIPEMFELNRAGVFYQAAAKTYVVHLSTETNYLLLGDMLQQQLTAEAFVRDTDGSYWLALYQRCVHLGTTVAFHNECLSFKCPSHGAHYHCEGEYLDGPAPKSMDRFPLSFHNDHLVVDTSQIVRVDHPSSTQRLLAVPLVTCSR